MPKVHIVALGIIHGVMQSPAFLAQLRALNDEIRNRQQIAQLNEVFGEQKVPVVRVHFGFQ